jgi:hypothetical protein
MAAAAARQAHLLGGAVGVPEGPGWLLFRGHGRDPLVWQPGANFRRIAAVSTIGA